LWSFIAIVMCMIVLMSKLRIDEISCSGRSGTRWQYGVPKWYDIVRRLGSPVIEEPYGILFTTQAEHKACYDGSQATSVRKANFVVKAVVLECCEKTVCLVPEITDIVNSGQTQRKCKSRAANRKHRVEQEKRNEQIKKKMPWLLTWVWDKLDL